MTKNSFVVEVTFKFYKLLSFINQSFFKILLVTPEAAIESFLYIRPNNLRPWFKNCPINTLDFQFSKMSMKHHKIHDFTMIFMIFENFQNCLMPNMTFNC